MFQNKFEIEIFEKRRRYPRCKTMLKKRAPRYQM